MLVVWFRGGEMTAGEIDERFQHAWPTTSRHLRVLEKAGLIIHEKQGRTRIYRVNAEKLQVVSGWLEWFKSPAAEGPSSNPTGKPQLKKKSRRTK
jgi:DNA-binding transcriptional ArsR family regulator